ncbi:uncharacterized protein M421DRAFT_10693 [Didymella exigua CBS 183.55]|uniref:BZIP domain-containing protein n=1 Tax=Didymella exigua CBS 183.55 TaxID=1150837 RepID=A0A6A5R8W7_9PLEO|nr:uncharacterized protein M421DRAFT_10693 [Didymella exigua CBS 183.55]KAF1922257.1 hypothetical protein M421DRAFT_10693 [Didymella exigua CBS 183.55]
MNADQPTTEQPQNPHQRRREQVRRAQKTHRERKESYIKSLETEVIQLRANETQSYHKIKALYAEVNAMKNLLVENGIRIPSALPSPLVPQIYSPDDVEVAPALEFFEFNIPGKSPKQQGERISVKTSARQGGNREAARTHNAAPTTFDLFTPPTETDFSQQDPTAIGIEFILSLEAPCLGHIPGTLDNEEPSGHALLTSATLLHHQQSYPVGHGHLANPTWTVPKLGVERLLELSTSIPLDGEVTPVQAWDYIRQHPQYHSLDCARLESLKATLLLHVKCYGFGAVIAQDVFENAVFDMFIEGGFF